MKLVLQNAVTASELESLVMLSVWSVWPSLVCVGRVVSV